MLDLRILRFAIIVCLGCSLLVSGAAIGLRERQEANRRLDMRKNILKSVGLLEEGLTDEGVNEAFVARMKGVVLTSAGEILAGRTPDDVDPDAEPDLLFFYEHVEGDEIVAYTLPISGKGLWSTIYGYVALEPDLNTVKGLTFYQHGETPGLGGEIEKAWFTESFVGKKILSPDGEVVSVSVVKGKATDRHSGAELDHYVDGISGATITGNGVTQFLKADLERYEPYFRRVRAATPEETT